MAPRKRSTVTGSSDVPRPFDGLREIDELTLEDRATVEGARLRDTYLSGAAAAGVELLESHLVNVALGETRLRSARLRDTVLERCDLSNADCSFLQSNVVLFDDCRGMGLVLVEASLRETTIRAGRFDYLNCRMATLTNVTFDDVSLREADFQGARLKSVRFARCDLSGADFRDARLDDVDLRGSTLDALAGVGGLRGAIVDSVGLVSLGPSLAAELGIQLDDGETEG
jgi:uncharacterized protein YjbI with pentapeptide repeats